MNSEQWPWSNSPIIVHVFQYIFLHILLLLSLCIKNLLFYQFLWKSFDCLNCHIIFLDRDSHIVLERSGYKVVVQWLPYPLCIIVASFPVCCVSCEISYFIDEIHVLQFCINTGSNLWQSSILELCYSQWKTKGTTIEAFHQLKYTPGPVFTKGLKLECPVQPYWI